MEAFEVGHAAALLAGLLSFGSPCVLPLVPAYLCFLGGLSFEELSEPQARPAARLLPSAFAFVLGFSAVFVAMGASASAINRLLFAHFEALSLAAGLVIAVLGLHYMRVFRLGFLDFERRLHLTRRPAGLVGAFVVGLAFAFGWTPCVGPVLASILLVAQSGRAGEGALLLGAYAAGLGLPFIAAALAAGPFLRLMARLRPHQRRIELALGAMLVATGVLIATGWIADVGFWLLDLFPQFGRVG